jgi:hypothetical protein
MMMFFWVLMPSTWQQNPEDHYHPHSCENLKSHMANLSHNVSTNLTKELKTNSHSEEQCTANVSDIEHRT